MAYINEYPKYFSNAVDEKRWQEIFGKSEKTLDKKKKQRKVKSSRKNKK